VWLKDRWPDRKFSGLEIDTSERSANNLAICWVLIGVTTNEIENGTSVRHLLWVKRSA
jgi:hypothetical protein